MKFSSTLSVEHSRIKTKIFLNYIQVRDIIKALERLLSSALDIMYSFLSFENLSTERFISSLMCFLNFSAICYMTVSYNRILRVV